MSGRVRQAMKAMQAVRPAAHNNQLTEPGPKRRNEPGEGLQVLHSAASLDDSVQDTLSDHVRLFPSAR